MFFSYRLPGKSSDSTADEADQGDWHCPTSNRMLSVGPWAGSLDGGRDGRRAEELCLVYLVWLASRGDKSLEEGDNEDNPSRPSVHLFLCFYLLFLAITVLGFSAGQVYPSSFSHTVILLLRRSQNIPNSVSDGLDEDAVRFSAIHPPRRRFQYSGP